MDSEIFNQPLRWGIAGCGKISNDFAAALSSLSKAGHKIVAAAARDVKSAADFSQTFSIPKYYGSYEELVQDPDVDVVYVGTINSTHFEICKSALENDKHVLCEKSLTLLLKHTEELIRLAEEKKKFFQEAVWTRFFPATKKFREDIAEGVIGDVKLITVTFGWVANESAQKKKLGGGTLMWLGVYPLQLVLAVCGPEMPEKIQACGTVNEEGVDTGVGIVLKYQNGIVAQLTTSFLVDLPNEAHIFGSEGAITLPKPFHCPTEILVNGEKQTFPLPTVNFPLEYTNSQGMVYQAEEVRNCIEIGLLESPHMTHHESITIAAIMEEIQKQIGMTFSDLYQ